MHSLVESWGSGLNFNSLSAWLTYIFQTRMKDASKKKVEVE